MKFENVGGNKFKIVENVDWSKPSYEWVLEELDEYDDVNNVIHPDKSDLPECLTLSKQPNYDLALVRDRFNMYGEHIRGWAYVKDGRLPEHFSDASGNNVGKVPPQFRKFIENISK